MGTTPLSECSRRKINEEPCPARRGATPLGTRVVLVSIELAEEATKPTPYERGAYKQTFHYQVR
jgi:hypothetical protein